MGSSGGANGCPVNTYCVKNDGRYPRTMSITNALAQSPNTAFVKLLQQVGVPSAVDMAVKLGMRSYAQPGTSGQGDLSLADYVKQGNFGSFTLGPNAVNPLELANVAAPSRRAVCGARRTRSRRSRRRSGTATATR